MQLTIEVNDNKAEFLISLLNDLKYVKISASDKKKAKLISELKEAKVELDMILKGEKEAIDARELLNEI